MNKLHIETVQEYNSRQHGLQMQVLCINGEPRKRGFVVTCNDISKFVKTKEEAEALTEKDFQMESDPVWYYGAGLSNVEAMNN